jgi:hypothetical protein
MSSSTYNFNEFKTYLSFAFRTSGNCKLNIAIKNEVSNHLGISHKTLNKHIKTLIEKGYFGYNPKTNVLFINGLEKIKRIVYINTDYNDNVLTRTSFRLNVNEIKNLKFLIFSASENFILKYQSKYKKGLKFEEYLTKNGYTNRYNNGSDNTKKQIRKFFLSEEKAKGDSMKKENPNHFGLNLFVDDRDYLGVSNTFISEKFNRTKSWGCKLKKQSFNLNLLNYNKKAKYIDTFPITFNVKRYLSINCPTTYHKFFCKKDNNNIVVFERGYDEIISYVTLSRRKF